MPGWICWKCARKDFFTQLAWVVGLGRQCVGIVRGLVFPGTYAAEDRGQESYNPRGTLESFDPMEPTVPKRSCVEGRFCATKGIARATGSQLACQLLTTQERVTLVFVVFALSTIL